MKEAIFAVGFSSAVAICGFAGYRWRPMRDALLLAMVFGTTIADRLDINLLGREWYRGTTRGIEISFVDALALALLISGMLAARRDGRRFFWPCSLGWLLAYMVYSCLNVAISDPKIFGIWELSKILRGVIAFLAAAYYVRGQREIRMVLIGLSAAIALEAATGLTQRYVYGLYRIGATFPHPNGLSMYACIAGPLLVAAAMAGGLSPRLRAWFGFCGLLAVGCVILSISRTGFAAILFTSGATLLVCFGARPSFKQAVGLLLVAVVLAGMIAKSWQTVSARYETATLAGELSSREGRGMYFRLLGMIVKDRLLGVGLNNWSYWVTQKYGPDAGLNYTPYSGTDVRPVQQVRANSGLDAAQAPPAHSLIAITLGELGWPGLILLTGAWVQWFRMSGSYFFRRTGSLTYFYALGAFFALMAAFLQSMTEWEFRLTPIFLLLHILFGALAPAYAVKRADAAASGGARWATLARPTAMAPHRI